MTCCYLCKSSFECSLKRGGVFVPLQDHFEQYCLTDNFNNCSHFIQYAMSCGVGPHPAYCLLNPTLSHADRRTFVRHDAQYPVTLSAYDSDITLATDHDVNALAQTVDLAQGGMRVRALTQVAKQGVLLFNFGEGFIAPLLHGLAEVCWQKIIPENGQWEAGLSFKDQFVKAVIAVQMSS